MLSFDSSDPTHFVIPSTSYDQFVPGTYTVSYYVSFHVETSGEYIIDYAAAVTKMAAKSGRFIHGQKVADSYTYHLLWRRLDSCRRWCKQ